MVEAVVRTKLVVPRPRPRLVARSRLSERLVPAADAALVLVSAPAGFGKTTLLASALEGTSSVAWVSLDARDRDPTVFWTYVLAALETVEPGSTATAGTLLDGPGGVAAAVAAVVNELSVRPGDLTLVLDDYHLADAPEVAESMSSLLEHRPPQLRVVISTRADSDLPLSRWRARGELVELRAADLRFTVDEAASYLNRVHDLGLSPGDVATLESRTEGWAAALQLAALSLRGRDDATSFVASFAGDDRYVVDYLVDEVLDRQPEQLRRFLLDTSVLERLTGELCDAVTGPVDGASGQAVLELLERRNLLLVPLDDRRRWYRYHHLFGDVLQARLLAERPEDLADLHERASVWHEQAGDVEAAVRHAFAAGDVDRAADLIELAAPELRRRRSESVLRSWAPRVPPEVLARRPVLASSVVLALMASNVYDGAADRLDALERSLGSPETLVVRDRAEWQRLPAQLATQRAGLALVSGDLAATIAHARTALDRADEGDRLTHASASALLGLAAWAAGDLDAAHRGYVAAFDGLVAVGHTSDALGCTVALVDLDLQRGDLDAADAAARRALVLAEGTEDTGTVVRGVPDIWLCLAAVTWERGLAEETVQHLARTDVLGETAGLPQEPYRWRVALAAVRDAEGDPAAADALLAEAERLFTSDFLPDARPVSSVRARLQVRTGDLAAARRWADAAEVSVDDDPAYLREHEHLTLARLLLAEHAATGDPSRLEGATGLLHKVHEAAAEGGRAAAVVDSGLLLTVAADAAGRSREALDRLQEVADLVRPRGWLRPLLDAGPQVTELLALLPDGAELAAALGPPSVPSAPIDARATLVVPLSERELDVLRLLGSDLDGPAIARHLHVSLATVRTHTQHIYAKLGVNNRRAAVRRAHQLRL